MNWIALQRYRIDVNLSELTFRPIDLSTDADIAFNHYADACRISYGLDHRCITADHHRNWLAKRIEEFPDGHLLAFAGARLIGQLELQVPYGSKIGYVNLFYVAKPYRRLGFGRQLHTRAEKYFRSWEADQIELHVARANLPALQFYRRLGYRSTQTAHDETGLILMQRVLTISLTA